MIIKIKVTKKAENMNNLIIHVLNLMMSFKNMLLNSREIAIKDIEKPLPKNKTKEWKILKTLPKDTALVDIYMQLSSLEEQITDKKTQSQIFQMQKEFITILKQIYYYPVIGRDETKLRFYYRHILDNLLQETTANTKIKGKNHTIRIIEAYRSILQFQSSITKFLHKLNKNKFFADKISITDQQQVAIDKILSYLQDQLKTFQQVFKEVETIHQENIKNGIYDIIKHDDMGKDLSDFFMEINKKYPKDNDKSTVYVADKSAIVTPAIDKEDARSVSGIMTTPESKKTISHNPTPESTPTHQTPNTYNTAVLVKKYNQLLNDGKDYDSSPDAISHRRKLFAS